MRRRKNHLQAQGDDIPFGEPASHVARNWTTSERKLRKSLHSSDFVFDAEVAYGSIDHLSKVGGRPPIGQYLSQLWQRRHFIWRESRSKVSTQNARNRLGSAWLVIRPLLDAVFYWVIFGLVLQVGRGLPNYVAFVIIGVFMFQLTSAAISSGVNVVRTSKALIRAFTFPRASIVISLVAQRLLQQVPAILVMLTIIALVPPHAPPQVSWVLFPLILVLHTIFNLGVAFLFARLGAAWPDLSQAVSFAVRILMYGSAVIFPIERFVDRSPAALAIIEMNPIYAFLTAYRTILIDAVVPGPGLWLQMVGWAVGMLAAGFLLFWASEESYAREH